MPNTPISQQNVWMILVGVTVLGVVVAIVSPGNAVATLGFCGLICTNIFIYLKNAQKVDEVKTELKESNTVVTSKLHAIETTGRDTHHLVDGAMTTQLEIVAIDKRRLAGLTKDPADITAAEIAEKALAEHRDKQTEK